jgi:hypothetical protein
LFQRGNNFKIQPISKKNHLWWPCLLAARFEKGYFYMGPAIDPSYQALGDLAKQFQRKRILEIDPSETRISCGGHVC